MAQSSNEFDTPTILASEAGVLIKSKIHIDAPASLVFRSLRNTETWKDWNWYVPKVTITYQPPEDDHATAAEIAELVRNTSIIGSYDSDLTDGGAPGTRRPHSPDDLPPPRFRLASVSSQMSGTSDASQPRMSESNDLPTKTHNGASNLTNTASAIRKESIVSESGSTTSNQSGAAKFQAAQAARKASVAAGQEPSAVQNVVSNAPPVFRNTLGPPEASDTRRKSWSKKKETAQQRAKQQAQQNLLILYGEPSVRIQINTKLTFHVRMREEFPLNFTNAFMVVTEVSRPDDPIMEPDLNQLTRTTTHTLSRSGVYRVVWTSDHEGASLFNLGNIFSGSKMPKSMLHTERVHEIEPTYDGLGNETCTYRTWECQKGHAAKTVKKKYEPTLHRMFQRQAEGLKDFCEGLHAPKIDRRDFSLSYYD